MSQDKTAPSNAQIHVIGGGTVCHVRSHLAIAATAYGQTARVIHETLSKNGYPSTLHLTKMASAGESNLETNEDVSNLIDQLLDDPTTKVIVFNPAMADFKGQVGDVPSGKYATRLSSRESKDAKIELKMADKVIGRIKEKRPDIIVVAFKTTTNEDAKIQYQKGERLIKQTDADIVLANDTGTRNNMVLFSPTPKTKNGLETRPTIISQGSYRQDALATVCVGIEVLYDKQFKYQQSKPTKKPQKRLKL
ncbi:MAG: hypothetical protein CMP22_06685 [Rickettsiales bacterium]|nr:hypothetical protein [Rickettsiales bacterium]